MNEVDRMVAPEQAAADAGGGRNAPAQPRRLRRATADLRLPQGFSSRRPASAARPWITFCSMVRQGLGKTTLAQIVARELGVGFRPPRAVIVRAGDSRPS